MQCIALHIESVHLLQMLKYIWIDVRNETNIDPSILRINNALGVHNLHYP